MNNFIYQKPYALSMTEPILIEALGDAVNLRVLSFFIENPFEAYTVAEIARFSGISRNSVYKYLPLFLRRKYLVESNGKGRVRYRLNRSGRIIQFIDEFVDNVGNEIVGPIQIPTKPVETVVQVFPKMACDDMLAAQSA